MRRGPLDILGEDMRFAITVFGRLGFGGVAIRLSQIRNWQFRLVRIFFAFCHFSDSGCNLRYDSQTSIENSEHPGDTKFVAKSRWKLHLMYLVPLLTW